MSEIRSKGTYSVGYRTLNQYPYNSQCSGGFPCKSCLKASKSKIWKGPCVKADFLDMVQSGPYFACRSLPFTFCINYMLTHVVDGFAYQQTRFNREDSLSIQTQMFIMETLSQQGGHLIVQSTKYFGRLLPPCAIPWMYGVTLMANADLDLSQHKLAIPSDIAKKIKRVENAIPERTVVIFAPPEELSDGDWFVSRLSVMILDWKNLTLLRG